MPYLLGNICFSHSLEQVITRLTEETAVIIDHILPNSSDKVRQAGTGS